MLILKFSNRCLNCFYFAAEQVLYRNIKDGKLYAVKVVLSATLFCVVSIHLFYDTFSSYKQAFMITNCC
jgi:hypothetical protein